jgi:hypothetical protein
MVERCAGQGLLRTGGRVRTDATHVLACARALNRLEFVTETVRAALEALAVAAPHWPAEHDLVPEARVRRYGARADYWRLPQGETERAAWAQAVGVDGFTLLDAIAGEADRSGGARWPAQLPAVALLRRIREQQYVRDRRRATAPSPHGEDQPAVLPHQADRERRDRTDRLRRADRRQVRHLRAHGGRGEPHAGPHGLRRRVWTNAKRSRAGGWWISGGAASRRISFSAHGSSIWPLQRAVQHAAGRERVQDHDRSIPET